VRHELSDPSDEFGGILWHEVNILVNHAKLTIPQRAAFDSYLRGLSLRQSADKYSVSKSTMQDHLMAALRRVRAVPHVGLITVTAEMFRE
jgi:DNA-directed RNA polymerase specialized sigma24 family protein